jgi:hypothetical protein
MSMFHVGQRVVCVSAPKRPIAGLIDPVTGCVYTVRGIDPIRLPTERTYGIYLEEIHNSLHPIWEVEYSFYADRFRPVKDTSIEVFRSLLSPIPEEVA